MDILHLARRHLRIDARHAFAGPLVIAVSGEMLGRRSDLVIGLHARSHRHAEFGHQIGGFAENLFIAPPPLVAPHVEDRSVDIRIPQQPGFAADDASGFTQQFAVPGMPHAQLGRKIRRPVSLHAANPLVGHVDGNAQTGLLDKKTLRFVDGPRMARRRPYQVAVEQGLAPLHESVEVLVDSPEPVLPELILPAGCRQRILQHALIAVERHQLAGLLFNGHLRQQVFDSVVQGGLRVLVNILAAVLVEIDPTVPIHFLVLRLATSLGLFANTVFISLSKYSCERYLLRVSSSKAEIQKPSFPKG